MSNRMDRQGARTPADLERKYNFEQSFAEIMGVATDARLTAEEAKSVATSIKETSSGITLKVESLDKDINGADGVKAQLDLKVGTDADGNLTSKVHIGSDMLTIDTENLTLDEEGNIKVTGEINATSGDIGGCDIGEEGITTRDGYVASVTRNPVDGNESTIALYDGVINIISPTIVSGVHRYVPLIQFLYTDPTTGAQSIKKIVADHLNGEKWLLLVADGPFFDFGDMGTV